MSVIASSRELEAAIYSYSSGKSDDAKNKCIELFEPFVSVIAGKHPMWLRDDLKQDLRLYLHKHLPKLILRHQEGKVRKLVQSAIGMLDKAAITISQKYWRDNQKYVSMDDIEIEAAISSLMAVDPNDEEIEHRDLINYLKEAADSLVGSRFTDVRQSRRASRWTQAMIKGKRPVMMTQAVATFNRSRYGAAKHMYSIVLHRLREMLNRQLGDVM